MSTLLEKIMEDIRFTENVANKEKYVGGAKEIRIHPNKFYDLMTDPKIHEYISDPRKVTILGLPVIRDPKISTWKVIM